MSDFKFQLSAVTLKFNLLASYLFHLFPHHEIGIETLAISFHQPPFLLRQFLQSFPHICQLVL
ncbi:MAG: hypothetical protein FJ004_08435 [Chloroflexi bacterium]|nr:hypothetical protein [Chloroflexota bacterium]